VIKILSKHFKGLNSATAWTSLGNCYENGLGCSQDLAMATQCKERERLAQNGQTVLRLHRLASPRSAAQDSQPLAPQAHAPGQASASSQTAAPLVLPDFFSIASSSQPASFSLAFLSVSLPNLTTNSLFQQLLTTNNQVTSLQNQITMQNARIQQLEAQLEQKTNRPKTTKRRYAEINSSFSTQNEAILVPVTTAASATTQSQEERAMKSKSSFKK